MSQTMPYPPMKLDGGPKRIELRGLFSGTKVAVKDGWQTVETLTPGTEVWTFDGGLQAVEAIDVRDIPADGIGAQLAAHLVTVPAGTLANAEDLVFLPSTGLLLECEKACDKFGDPFAVVPVSALAGVCGVKRGGRSREYSLHRLRFAREQVVYIDGGLAVHCPVSRATAARSERAYDVKSRQVAKKMLTDLDVAELAVREANEDFRVSFDGATPASQCPHTKRGAQSPSLAAFGKNALGKLSPAVKRLRLAARSARKNSGFLLPSRAADPGS